MSIGLLNSASLNVLDLQLGSALSSVFLCTSGYKRVFSTLSYLDQNLRLVVSSTGFSIYK